MSVERTGFSIMVEGRAELLATTTPELAAALIATFNKKYRLQSTADDWTKGGLWAIHAQTVFAWKFANMGTTATRFRFDRPAVTTSSPSNGAQSVVRADYINR